MSQSLELLRQFTTIDGILAGFAILVIVQLIIVNNKGDTVTRALRTFIFCAVVLLAATFIGVFSLAVVGSLPTQIPPQPFVAVVRIIALVVSAVSAGVVGVLLLGIGEVGNIYDPKVGQVATKLALIACLVLMAAVVALLLTLPR